MTDSERLDWLEHHLFYKRWNGVLDDGDKFWWRIDPEYRHKLLSFEGQSLRQAIDKAQEVFP